MMFESIMETLQSNWILTFAIVTSLYILYLLYSVSSIDIGLLDTATKNLLKERSHLQVVPKECHLIVNALETAEMMDDEAMCAEQMRVIVAKEYLQFSTLVNAPETLLRCSPGNFGSNGALWTRYEVKKKKIQKELMIS